MSRIRNVLVTGVIGLTAAAAVSAPAQAAPQGHVNPGHIIFGTQFGTGCRYVANVAVNASGTVTFWDWKGKGYKPLYVGKDYPRGGVAAVNWIPRREGIRHLYAVQNGQKSKITNVRVTRGYGGGWTCIAF
ncbi:MAG: hypothetical protein QM774_12110 [Gordonia sp. (in: high G+C Gram-positive bacteria)]|uniref:hypothetical protein n=1 Tax=Gordonia sp. (in: high G+C Gram-positive bacteria) TaxID=84139 RepID=UPI0039E583BB